MKRWRQSSGNLGSAWRTALSLTALLATAAADGHPIAPSHHDRSLQVQLTRSAITVEYVLAIDGWTLLRDLVPFRQEIPPGAGDGVLLQEFARRFGPLIAEGLAAELDGQKLSFDFVRHQLVIEDHLRFTFTCQTPVRLDDESEHVFSLSDTNFDLEPGLFKAALRGDGGVRVHDANVAADLESAVAIPLHEHGFDLDKKLRTMRASFRVPHSMPASAPPAEEPIGLAGLTDQADVSQMGRLRQLVQSRQGLAIVLALAFAFGAAHALQPGHGKTLVAAYLVGEQGTIAHAFFLGLVTTLTHTSVVFLLAIVVPLVYPRGESTLTFGLSLGCGLLVTCMAIWLLLRRLSGQADHVHLFGGHHHHGHARRHHHHAPPTGEKVRWWSLVVLGMTGGLVPCMDALGLLTLTWVTKQMWLGLPLILAFSAGLASVLVATGILVVKLKRFAQSRWGEGRIVRVLPIASALATLGLGLWMCHAALKEHESSMQLRLNRTSHLFERQHGSG